MSRTIALADDDPTNRTLVERVLTTRGYTVLTAQDGVQALEVAGRPGVDLVILDWMMPGMTGLQVLAELRARGNPVPVIMLTALDSPADVASALEQGADDYVSKPFSPVVLLARVERRLKARAPQDAAPPGQPASAEPLPSPPSAAAPAQAPAPVTAPPAPPPDASAAPDPAGPAVPPTGPAVTGNTLELMSDSAIITQPPAAAPLAPPPLPPVTESLTAAPPPPPHTPPPAGTGDANPFTSFFGRLKRAVTRTDLPAVTQGALLSNRYRIGPVVGEGAFGVVYRARHVDLETDVAVKILRAEVMRANPGHNALERFRHEAVRACRVRHPNAVRVMDFGLTGERRAYLVMELLEGTSLATRLRGGPVPPQQGARIMSAILSALAEAHRQGVIHQDVKESNIFLHREGGLEVPKLIDFGAAVDPAENNAGIIIGTPTHMAPERFDASTGDARSDVYAAGITLYAMVTGILPFLGNDMQTIRAQQSNLEPVPPTEYERTLTSAWDQVVLAMLHKDPARRPTAAEAAERVAALATQP